jgi:hypothetical protein
MRKNIFVFVFLIGILFPLGFSKNCGGDISCECGDTVTSSYVMEEDLYCEESGLFIRTNLNCDGNSLVGSGDGFGLSVSVMDKKLISNCEIENFEKGLILGDVGTNDKSELNSVTNSYFKNNDVGIFSGTYVSRNKIIDNVFEGNTKSIQVTGGGGTLIVNNTFLDSTIFMSYTGAQIICQDGFSNSYMGDVGSTCECLQPQDNLYVNSDTVFCPGEYVLPNGIRMGTKVDLICENTHLMGIGSNSGMFWEGSEYSSVNGCYISNYTNGIEFKHRYYSNGYSTIVNPAKNNDIANLTIFDVDIGVKTFYTSPHGDSKAESITNSSIIARSYAIYNPTSGFIDATHNFYGTNDGELIPLLFKNSEKIHFEPYIEKYMPYDLSIDEYRIKNNMISVDIKSDTFLIDNVSILLRAQRDGKVVMEKEESLIFSYDKIKTFFLEDDNYDFVYIQIDPNLEKLSQHTDGTQMEIGMGDFLYRLDFSYDSNIILEDTLYDFLETHLFVTEHIFDYEKTLSIEFGIVNSEIPYSFSISSSDDNIIITSHTTEGILSGIISFLEKRVYFENNNVEFTSLADSSIGLAAYDFLELEENRQWDNTITQNFRELILLILNQEYFTTQKIFVPIEINGSVSNYLIEKREPNYSTGFISHITNSEYPIILSGGIWGDIDSFEQVAKKLTQIGYTTYTIEINGGSQLECDTCYNYYYEDLLYIVLPQLVQKIKEMEEVDQIIYVGHSNGGRTFLDSLSQNSIQSEEIFAVSLLGVPGAFEDLSLLGSLIQSRGNLALTQFDQQEITHISQGDMALAFSDKVSFFNVDDILLDLVGLYMNFGDSTKISTHLFQQYFFWINSTDDIQPGENIFLKNFQLISGNPIYLSNNDVIVPLKDELEIFESISSENKVYLETDKLHFKMTNDESIFFEILDFIRGAY